VLNYKHLSWNQTKYMFSVDKNSSTCSLKFTLTFHASTKILSKISVACQNVANRKVFSQLSTALTSLQLKTDWIGLVVIQFCDCCYTLISLQNSLLYSLVIDLVSILSGECGAHGHQTWTLEFSTGKITINVSKKSWVALAQCDGAVHSRVWARSTWQHSCAEEVCWKFMWVSTLFTLVLLTIPSLRQFWSKEGTLIQLL